jgi:hypothetical protein
MTREKRFATIAISQDSADSLRGSLISNATAALICPGHVLIRPEIRPVQLESIAAITYWAGTVRFAGPVNGNTPLVEVVSAPRRVAGVPLVPTTQRSEELLANCAVDSHVAPDASRAPHEPD